MKNIAKRAIGIMLLWSTLLSGTIYAADESAEVFSQQELHQLLAPVALYPDTVLTHVLISSTYPLEVVRADRWRQSNPNLDSESAVNAGEDKGWDPSVSALLAFPDLLTRMSEDLDWTQRLGEAFIASEEDVLGAIQALRQQAYDSGNLTDLEHLDVSREDGNIIIAPVRREVVYVPYYDSHRVYGSWLWPSYPPAYWSHSYASHYNHRGFYWGIHAPIHYGFYFGGFHWGHRNVIVIHDNYSRRNLRRRYSGRQLANHNHARRWQHQSAHRRGVRYRDARVLRSPRTSRHASIRTRQDQVSRRVNQRNDRTQINRTRETQRQVRTTRTAEPRTTRRESLQQRMSDGKKNSPQWRSGTPKERTVTQTRNVNRERVAPQPRNPSQQRTVPRRDPAMGKRVQRERTVQQRTESDDSRTRSTTRSTTRTINRSTSRAAPSRGNSRTSRQRDTRR